MRRISQRELRNESGEIMREVSRGVTFEVMTRGVPIAVLSPISSRVVDEHTARESTRPMRFAPGARIAERTEDVLADLRGNR